MKKISGLLVLSILLLAASPMANAQTAISNVLTHVGNYQTFFIGNTDGRGGDIPCYQGRNIHNCGYQIQRDIDGISVDPATGTVFANTWAEDASRMYGIYQNGKNLGFVNDPNQFYRFGGAVTAVNSKYVFITQAQGNNTSATAAIPTNKNNLADYPAFGSCWYGLSRMSAAASHQSATFPTAYGWDTDFLKVGEKPPTTVSNNPCEGPGNIWGLAIDNNDRLYVSDTINNHILVYNSDTMAAIQSAPWATVQGVKGLAWDNKNQVLWAISTNATEQIIGSTAATKIVGFSVAANGAGVALPSKTINFPGQAVALAIDPNGDLAVADNGVDQNVKVYSNIAPSSSGAPVLAKTFGVKSGIFAGPVQGQIGNLRFNGLTGVGFDNNGNIYVSYDGFGPELEEDGLGRDQGQGAFLESYNYTSQALNWRVHGLQFVDNIDFDPSDPTSGYGSSFQYKLNLTQNIAPAGQPIAYTINPFKYPKDFRWLSGNTHHPIQQVVEIQGHKFLVVNSVSVLAFYRFNSSTDGDIAIPSTMFDISGNYSGLPIEKLSLSENQGCNGQKPTPVWTSITQGFDGHFDSAYVDKNGAVWLSGGNMGISNFPLQGFDACGNPQYNLKVVNQTASPAYTENMPLLRNDTWSGVESIHYDADKQVLFLTAFTTNHPRPMNNKGKLSNGTLGTVLVRYDHWPTQFHGQVNIMPTWEYVFPPLTAPPTSVEAGWNEILPESISYAGNYIFVQYCELNQINVLNATMGLPVSIPLTPDVNVTGTMDGIWTDFRWGVHAVQIPGSNVYGITVEDDIYNKSIFYRWTAPQ